MTVDAVTETKLWDDFFALKNFTDIYSIKANYDTCKIICYLGSLGNSELIKELPYEEIIWIADRMHELWKAACDIMMGRETCSSTAIARAIVNANDILRISPWAATRTVEYGYVQNYVDRVWYFIMTMYVDRQRIK